MTSYTLIGVTIIFTVCGQLLIKGGVLGLPNIPTDINQVLPFLTDAFTNLKILSCLLCAVFASITWMGALSRTEISFAYPFMGLAIVLVLALALCVYNNETTAPII